MSKICEHSEHLYLWSRKPDPIQQHVLDTSKVTDCCDGHVNGVIGQYLFNSGTVRKVDFSHILDTYVQSGSKLFPQNAAFTSSKVLLTLHGPSIPSLMNRFQIHGLDDISNELASQIILLSGTVRFPPRICGKPNVSYFCA